MNTTNKFIPEWEIQGFYSGVWECVTTEETRQAAWEQIACYRENERGTAFRMVRKYVKNPHYIPTAKRRLLRLLHDGVPRYVRCYDLGTGLDRNTVVFTGGYRRKISRWPYRTPFLSLGMSENPYSGVGHRTESDVQIDRPGFSNLGKKIAFNDLPADCQRWALDEYYNIWNLKSGPADTGANSK